MTHVADCPHDDDSRILSTEERLQMAAAMKANCESLTALLQRLVEEEQDLKRACAEFILRDVEEENRRMELTRRCLAEQQHTTRSAAFVKWAMERGTWETSATEATEQPGPDGWFMFLETTKFSTPLRLFTLPSVLVQQLLKWRGSSKFETSTVESLELVRAVLAEQTGEPIVVLVNGHILMDGITPEDVPARERTHGFRQTAGEGLAALHLGWRDFMIRKAAQSPLGLLLEKQSFEKILIDDGSDVISFSPVSSLLGGLPFQAVLRGPTIIACETPLPEANTEKAAGISLGEAVAALQPASTGMRLSAPSSALRLVRAVARRLADGSIRVTIAGSQILTPDVAMSRYEWSDICGIARIAAESGSATVAFRSTKYDVAKLEPFDAASEVWYPVINAPVAIPSQRDEGMRFSTTLVAVAACGLCVATGWLLGRRK